MYVCVMRTMRRFGPFFQEIYRYSAVTTTYDIHHFAYQYNIVIYMQETWRAFRVDTKKTK